MTRTATYLTFTIIIMVVLIVVGYFFGQIALSQGSKAQNLTSPITQPEEVVEKSYYKALGMSETDSSGIVIYKLFRNFDPSFLNEKVPGSAIDTIYNSFMLKLMQPYPDGSNPANVGDLINNLTVGVKDFSNFDTSYKIESGTCIIYNDNSINFNNDCWTFSQTNYLQTPLQPCLIFVHGNSSNYFNERIKIRVGWHDNSKINAPTDQRDVIDVIITVCDDS